MNSYNLDMNRRTIISLTFLLSSMVSSCFLVDTQNSNEHFIEGNFVSYFDNILSKDNVAAKIHIQSITKEFFELSNGINVVQDYNGGENPYFSLEFSYRDKKSSQFIDVDLNYLECRLQPKYIWYYNGKYSLVPKSSHDCASAVDNCTYELSFSDDLDSYYFHFVEELNDY